MVKELPQLKIMSYLDSLNSNPPMNTHYLSEKQVFAPAKHCTHISHIVCHMSPENLKLVSLKSLFN